MMGILEDKQWLYVSTPVYIYARVISDLNRLPTISIFIQAFGLCMSYLGPA